MFGSPTEKTRDVVPPTEEDGSVEVEPTPKRKGHGRMSTRPLAWVLNLDAADIDFSLRLTEWESWKLKP